MLLGLGSDWATLLARIVLLAADGLSNRAIGERGGKHYNEVGLWRQRFEADGLAGLLDGDRPDSHPTYSAMLEVGRAQRTIFVARSLRLRDLQREIGGGLNVVESWNGANSFIAFGKGGDIATNARAGGQGPRGQPPSARDRACRSGLCHRLCAFRAHPPALRM